MRAAQTRADDMRVIEAQCEKETRSHRFSICRRRGIRRLQTYVTRTIVYLYNNLISYAPVISACKQPFREYHARTCSRSAEIYLNRAARSARILARTLASTASIGRALGNHDPVSSISVIMTRG